jgi:hypothetical protein
VRENFWSKAIHPHVGAFFVTARFFRLLKNSCFVSGHDFSRAAQLVKAMGFSPCHGQSYEKVDFSSAASVGP